MAKLDGEDSVTQNPEEIRENEQTLWQWLPGFLRHELAPYPGRWSLVARMVLAATLSMLVIVTFRIPYGAIGVNCAFILSRENLTSTAKSGFYFILAFAAWAALIPIGARMFAAVPITHFLWEGVTAFLCFFLLKTLTNFPLATGVVVVATATMAIWYLPGPAELNVELTLWQILATAIGALITFLVELVFRYWSPQNPLMEGIDDRMRVIEEMLNGYSKESPEISGIAGLLTQYAVTGTGTLRQQVARGQYAELQGVKVNALVSLLSRSIDLSAALVSSYKTFGPTGGQLAENLAKRVSAIRGAIRTGHLSIDLQTEKLSGELPFLLSELEAAVGWMEQVLRASNAAEPPLETLDEAGAENHVFVKDAFTNPEYVKYALAGTAASMLCYVIYVGLNWPGISTAVTTCILTALSNIGSSRQKQMLRLVGASIGGFVLGLGSQMFVLPYIDSIVGLTILLAFATGVSAYVATSSPRLSYVGLQMAFAFYLINVTDFSISLDLTIGRDRTVGILLGIGAMWLVFERLYSRPAGMEMVVGFARAAHLIANLTPGDGRVSDEVLVNRIRNIRADVPGLFTSVHAEADAVPFETGERRFSHLAARDRIRRWLPALRTIYLLELPLLEAGLYGDSYLNASELQESDKQFYRGISETLTHIAECLESQLGGATCGHSHHESVLDTVAPDNLKEHQGVSGQARGVTPVLQILTRLVDELEREVSREPVFAPRLFGTPPIQDRIVSR